MIQLNSDLIELLAAFEKNEVRYLIIGGYAVGYYAEPRYTKDCDFWIATDSKNAKAVHNTLKEFGAPLFGATAEDFQDQDAFFSFGEAPNRIDILMGPPGGIHFDEAWKARKSDSINGVAIHFASRAHLIQLKRSAGRDHDKRDIEALTGSDPENS